MDELKDETMSQEQAFSTERPADEGVQYSEDKDETLTDSQSESEQKEEDSKPSQEDKEGDVEDNRIPYSRFKKKFDELEEARSTIQKLEDRLADIEVKQNETAKNDDINVPQEWVQLYGDSDVSKRAYKIQLQREQQIEANAVKRVLDALKEESSEAEKSMEVNEGIIEQELEDLSESLGKKITPELEEEILTVVDEMSPVGRDGKYLSLFPFDKAYEIVQLRKQAQQNKTKVARTKVADLTNGSSSDETHDSSGNFRGGWDSWRNSL